MEWRMVRFDEEPELDRERGWIRYKKAIFNVNGSEHTLRISMKDFDEGRAPVLVAKEAEKIMAALQASGRGLGKDR